MIQANGHRSHVYENSTIKRTTPNSEDDFPCFTGAWFSFSRIIYEIWHSFSHRRQCYASWRIVCVSEDMRKYTWEREPLMNKVNVVVYIYLSIIVKMLFGHLPRSQKHWLFLEGVTHKIWYLWDPPQIGQYFVDTATQSEQKFSIYAGTRLQMYRGAIVNLLANSTHGWISGENSNLYRFRNVSD